MCVGKTEDPSPRSRLFLVFIHNLSQLLHSLFSQQEHSKFGKENGTGTRFQGKPTRVEDSVPFSTFRVGAPFLSQPEVREDVAGAADTSINSAGSRLIKRKTVR